MPQPMQQQRVVRAVFDRRGEPVASATIAGRTFRIGEAFGEVAADLDAIGAEAEAR